ncbi:matrix protein [Killamcar virus 1]|nr:matrix protein [Killamcar virus 1]
MFPFRKKKLVPSAPPNPFSSTEKLEVLTMKRAPYRVDMELSLQSPIPLKQGEVFPLIEQSVDHYQGSLAGRSHTMTMLALCSKNLEKEKDTAPFTYKAQMNKVFEGCFENIPCPSWDTTFSYTYNKVVVMFKVKYTASKMEPQSLVECLQVSRGYEMPPYLDMLRRLRVVAIVKGGVLRTFDMD